jgi:hypothetical protein
MKTSRLEFFEKYCPPLAHDVPRIQVQAIFADGLS